jgi:hypothetical protein
MNGFIPGNGMGNGKQGGGNINPMNPFDILGKRL